MNKIDCISDLHGCFPTLLGGNLLIVAGDLTASDTTKNHLEFIDWLKSQQYTHKVFIGGNHDNYLQKGNFFGDFGDDCIYLCDSGIELSGLKIWGSPWTTSFKNMNSHCMAFTVKTDQELAEKWALIPNDTDILITHSPAYGTHDRALTAYLDKKGNLKGESKRAGSKSLKNWIDNHKSTLKLHVCGHIHEGYGVTREESYPIQINAAHMDRFYFPVNPPIRIEL